MDNLQPPWKMADCPSAFLLSHVLPLPHAASPAHLLCPVTTDSAAQHPGPCHKFSFRNFSLVSFTLTHGCFLGSMVNLRGTRTPRGESEKSQDPLLSIQPHIVIQAMYNSSMVQVPSVKVSLQKKGPGTHPTGIFWVPTVCQALFQEQTCTKQENLSSPGASGLELLPQRDQLKPEKWFLSQRKT